MNPDLQRWIDEASKGLEPLARTKITEQITEHYQDSVAGYRSSGLNDVDACSSAILDLGSSKLAHSRYRGQFFSESEYKWIHNIENQPFKSKLHIALIVLILLMCLIFFVTGNSLYKAVSIGVTLVLVVSTYFLINLIMFLSISGSFKSSFIVLAYCIVFTGVFALLSQNYGVVGFMLIQILMLVKMFRRAQALSK